jgi:hypothetical protein
MIRCNGRNISSHISANICCKGSHSFDRVIKWKYENNGLYYKFISNHNSSRLIFCIVIVSLVTMLLLKLWKLNVGLYTSRFILRKMKKKFPTYFMVNSRNFFMSFFYLFVISNLIFNEIL